MALSVGKPMSGIEGKTVPLSGGRRRLALVRVDVRKLGKAVIACVGGTRSRIPLTLNLHC